MGAGSNAPAVAAAFTIPAGLDFAEQSNKTVDNYDVRKYLELLGTTEYGLLYDKWRNHEAGARRWQAKTWGTPEDHRMIDDLRDAAIGRMRQSAYRLAALSNGADAIKTAITGMQGRLQDAWKGKAAEAAVGQFDAIAKAAQACHDVTKEVYGHESGATDTYHNAMLTLEAVWTQKKIPMIDITNVELRSTQVDRINYRLYTEHSHTVAEMKEAGKVDLNEGGGLGSDTWWSNDTIAAMDKLCDQYQLAVNAFRAAVQEIHGNVSTALTDMNTGLQGIANTKDLDPFGKLALPTVPEGPKTKDPGQDKKNTGSVDPGKGSVDPGTGTVDPGMSGIDQGTDPSSAVDPGTTQPGQQQPGQQQPGRPEQVTIQDGDRTITVQSPDGRGHVKVGVGDGKGGTKTYDLDFDDESDTTGSGVVDGDGDPDTAVIHDGDTTITAERQDGDNGHIKLTVDDGTGNPTSYDIDFDDQEADPSGGQVDPGASPDPAADTSASAGGDVSAGGGGGSVGGGGGGGGGDYAGGGSTPSDAQQTLAPGATTGSDTPTGSPDHGSTAPAGAGVGAAPTAGPGGGGMGGMPMGGMGGGGGKGGDSERGASQWRTTGNLFDDEDPASNFDGVIGDEAPKQDPPRRVRP